MRKIFFKISLLMIAWIVFTMCDYELPAIYRLDADSELHAQILGNWESLHAILLEENQAIDVTSFFDDFKVEINSLKSTCCINGCENWVTTECWKNSSNTFRNGLTGSSMVFIIQDIPQEDAEVISIFIEIENPGFTFLPEGRNVGTYLIAMKRK